MKIAYISYEFPPETGYGGIGTYTYQIATALAAKGHYIEVFSSSPTGNKRNIEIAENLLLHRVKAGKRSVFSELIVEVFRERSSIVCFDIIESPEYCAEGLEVRKAFPDIPMIVKLHAPLFLINKINNIFLQKSLKKRLKSYIGLQQYNKMMDKDYQLTSSVNAICAPSYALAGVIKKTWQINSIDVIPNIFIPPHSYLSLPVLSLGKTISFIGKLNVLKGMKSLTDTIPFVLKKHPDAKFRFIGRDGEAPGNNRSMKEYMLATLHKYSSSMEFIGYDNNEDIPTFLTDTDIIVLPSLWENYPYTCLEAMSAGKAMLCSDKGV